MEKELNSTQEKDSNRTLDNQIDCNEPSENEEQVYDLEGSFFSDLSRDSSIIVRKGSQDRVIMKKCYSETVEIALLTLNDDKQNRRESVSSDGVEGELQDQLLKYNNNKLFIPGLSECFRDDNTKFWKFPGENILIETSTQLTVLANGDTLTAKIILTNYRLLFVPSDQAYLPNRNLRSDYFSIPLSMINHVYKGLEKKNQPPNCVYISTKAGQKFRLTFAPENSYDFSVIHDIIGKFLPFPQVSNYFAFCFHAEYPHLEQSVKGWSVYNPQREFTRQGLILASELEPTDTLSNVERYAFKILQNRSPDGSEWICPTYPEEVVVPRLLSLDDVNKCSKFRTKNRFPALAYCYRPPYVGRLATIWRSSQCKHGLGLYNHRSDEDELYLRLIGSPYSKEVQKEGEVNVHIYDARPYLNAVANKMHGKGYENTTYYKNAEIFFLQIDNIHVVRDNYKKLKSVASDLNSEKWAFSHDHNGWIVAISLILTGAKTIIEKSLKKGINVLVHCSDGWDRTTQLISLVQIMLDPYYRTIEGFEVLIEKDWVSFGHMFRTRTGWKSYNPFEEDKRSPIFIQFLDCVHQLLHQYPFEFEFNVRFLTDLAYYSRAGLFGNFLCDNVAEMLENKVKEKTTSIWSYFNSNKSMYVSCLKDGLGDHVDLFKKEILPDTSFVNLRFWKEFFCFSNLKPIEKPQFKNIEMNTESDLYELALRFQLENNQKLRKENEMLLQRIQELTKTEDEGKIELLGETQHIEDVRPMRRKRTQKDENEFLIVDEEDSANSRSFEGY